MIIVAIWFQVGLNRGVRAPNFTIFFWSACFHTFFAGIITPLHTLYMYTRVWTLAWDNTTHAHAQSLLEYVVWST